MFMSDAGRQLLTEPSEGLRLIGYKDAVGVPTAGFGHTGRLSAPIPIVGKTYTKAEADQWLAKDLSLTEVGVTKVLKAPFTQHQFDALCDLAFNIGLGAFRSSSVLRLFNAKNYAGAANAILMWNKAGGKVLAGLVKRRGLERSWFLQEDPHEMPVALLYADEETAHKIDHPDPWHVRIANRIALLTA